MASIYTRFILFFIITSIIIIVKFQPLYFHPVLPGLDGSWQSALAYGADKRLLFGKDIVFTGGPLAGLYNRQFEASNAYILAAASLSVVFFISLCFSVFLARMRSILTGAAVLITLSLSLFLTSDVMFMIVPLLAALYGIWGEENSKRLVVGSGAFLSGIIVLAKFSVFPIAILSMLALDVLDLLRRRIPLHLVVFAGGLILAFVLAGQPLEQLPSFIKSSLEVSSGYSSAMSLPIQLPDPFVWLAVATLFVGTLLYESSRHWHTESRYKLVAQVLVISGYLFVAFKAGFVRHDLHMLIAWTALIIVILAVIAAQPRKQSSRWLLAGLAFACLIPGQLALYKVYRILPFTAVVQLPDTLRREASELSSFALSPSNWKKRLVEQNVASLASIKEQRPLPHLSGSVDTILNDQSSIIANGLDYRPRPTLQEYTTYSPSLIARNRSFFESDQAPDFLFMAPGSIDRRHPASVEGALWPLFFSKYQPYLIEADYLVLQKRALALDNIETNGGPIHARLNEEVRLPDMAGPVMASITIKPTIIGKLLNVFYRPPLTELVISYHDGSVETYRVIPGMLSEGLMVSPLVKSPSDYLLVSTGHLEAGALQKAKSVMVRAGFGGILAYRSDIDIQFSILDNKALRDGYKGKLADFYFEQQKNLSLLLENNPIHDPTVIKVPEGLLAHAPTILNLPVSSSRRLDISFGIREGAWRDGGQTNGVCFSVQAASSKIFERCLKPVENEADRPEQNATVELPSGTEAISLETSCIGACAWDWSYWARAVPRP
ncbi:hypothetical protein HWD97_13935 [Ochrobactrum sp. C6C9]|uniref:hypothetical protein n=1 Tax=Ochrobactrum sp. C6C9 TaxID=2736662 RepID=UPI0035302E60|nr:hypothetical protein [Ochrobactrum sp. C6C9]